MIHLIAKGPRPGEKIEWHIPESQKMLLGRSADNDCAIPWDSTISRMHAEFQRNEDQLNIRCFPSVLNQIKFDEQFHTELTISVGDTFQIGETQFQSIERSSNSGVLEILEDLDTDSGILTEASLRVTDLRIETVTKAVPSLWLCKDEGNLAKQAALLLKDVMPHADVVAVIQSDGPKKWNVAHWEQPVPGFRRVTIIRSLVRDTIRKGETAIEVESSRKGTPLANGRWAFCTPVKTEGNQKWCLYICGRFGEESPSQAYLSTNDLQDDLNLVELLAHMLSAIRRVRKLEDRFSGIEQFFSPAIIKVVSEENAKHTLEPTETETAVLFCDLRRFSHMTEQAGKNLQLFLDRLKNALGVMTQSISSQNGVIADFQGDSALGFWGWPLPLSKGALPACRAALQIHQMFKISNSTHFNELSGFEVGIGITRGNAIAGKIGTREQAKVGVFGPVVNLASRLEGMTKQLGVPILIDEATAADVRNLLPESEGRCRHLGLFRPPGLEAPLSVYELLPSEGKSSISNQNIKDFEAAVDAFIDGDWDSSLDLLGHLPPKDRARDFLLLQIASQNYKAPFDWDGVVTLKK
ncbi:adenylate/guanylate cyclase domain-containing protein [Gimesia fumaroli]|jgi:adenylate cyclase|uniref:Adenylate cyclase 2 n=1 Tax=Gimesia fumaroli TaxID=2527976 RepID=A0A518I9M5_9PLAN|nr:adenylate/guanylate cyclase domain-containing protein [Gimesia fumaroli]QDV49754.1 Adenylate cyclase 2 [Gimesia fumaroli]